jgi:predicted O-methyltransferase YrrM
MLEMLKTAVWFLKNPKYFSQIGQVLRRSKNKVHEDSREEATEWCKNNSVDQLEALNKIGFESEFKELKDLFPDQISASKKIEEECPFEMGGEGAISFLYHVVKQSKPKRVIESGVAYGWSTLAILLAIKNTDAKLISNDMPYVKMNNDPYVGCVVPAELRSQWELQRLADIDGIPKAIKKFKGEIDLFHYDSDKSYTGRMWSSPIIWQSLAKGGLFVSDDINDNLGFKYFCNDVNRVPIIIKHFGKYVGIIKK